MKKTVYVNDEVSRLLKPSLGKQADFQSFSGSDISAYIYLPLATRNSALLNTKNPRSKLLAEIQTISISSTRSISPVRVLGRESPVAYTRGARTFAGTLVFASVNQDVFKDIYDQDIASSMMSSSTSLTSDQLPPFSIIITAANEKGAAAIQAVHGVTLVNYGTTYSVDDLYTEVTYSYVATDVIPLSSSNVSLTRSETEGFTSEGYRNLGHLIQETMSRQYGSVEDKVRAIRKKFKRPGAGPDTYLGKYGTF